MVMAGLANRGNIGIRKSESGYEGRRRGWVVLAGLLVVGGVASAVFAAHSVARNDAEASRQSFQNAAGQVSSTLQLAIQHQNDLVVNAGAFFLRDPRVTNAQFHAWTTSVQISARYPEVKAIGYAVLVSAAELPAYAARAMADPGSALGPDRKFTLVPPGNRPFHCLSLVGQKFGPSVVVTPGLDFCAPPITSLFMGVRDSGSFGYFPYQAGKATWLAIETPSYRGGTVPATSGARQAAFVAWVGIVVDPKVDLDQALQGHPNTAVTLSHVLSGFPASFSSGTAPVGAQSVTIDLHNGWTVKTSGAAAGGGVFQNGNALATLIAGLAVSILLGVLVFVLGTGRGRALRLVVERTAQLRGAQAELVEAARQAGMVEIATNVLHNVGNVLNSVNVSADLVAAKVRGSKSSGLGRAVALMEQHGDDLGDFLTTDVRGRELPGYLGKLAATLDSEREGLQEELARLTSGVTHIKEIVAAQQGLAGVSGVVESVNINDLMEDALRMDGVADNDQVSVIRDFPDVELSLDRHRVLLVLLNLISNATHAMTGNLNLPRQLSLAAKVTPEQALRITVADNGEGIAPENLTQIFVHGFTTHAFGHGFGLHSSALAAKEMGGGLSVHSDGAGTGAKFTLEVPLERQVVTVGSPL
jgi:signal transduction histidine kinase